MGKKSKAPKAPSAAKTAQAQFEYGNSNIFGPNGNLVWGSVGSDGKFQADPNAVKYAAQIQETDFQKALRQAREGGTLDLVDSIVGAGLPDRAQIRDTSDIAQNSYDMFQYMNAPQRELEDRRTTQYLSDRGIPMIGEAGKEVLDDQQRRRTEADAQIMRHSLDRAGQEQSRMYGLESDARSGALNELITALTGVNPTPNNVSAPSGTGIDMASLMNNEYQGKLANWQQGRDEQNAWMQTAANVGMMLLSDRAMKTDIEPATGFLDGLRRLDISKWNYLPESGENPDTRHVGPMAQDFAEIFGVGDGRTIHLVDAVGVALGALKEIAEAFHVSDPDTRTA